MGSFLSTAISFVVVIIVAIFLIWFLFSTSLGGWTLLFIILFAIITLLIPLKKR